MRNLKRVLTISLAAVMLLVAMSVSAFAATTKFTDVNTADEALTKAVSLLEGLGITKGTSETTFGTNENVTREQMAAFIYRLMKGGKSLEGGENTTPFEDLYDDTYYGMISWADAMGIIKGISATEFNPDGNIVLQDAYTMLVRALDYEKNATLSYPHDYISIAEDKDVNLGNGLPSRVTYDTKLTRGNVAVLLYNAFYAETAIPEIVEYEKPIAVGTPNEKLVIAKKEEYPRLCEKVYKVVEEQFTVRETTHYAFNDSKTSEAYKPTEDANGEGTMLLVVSPDQANPKTQSFYTTLEELGLSGKADNYIMSDINVYYQYDDEEEELTKVLFAEALMTKDSAEAATYGTYAASNKAKSPETRYSASSTESRHRRMNGMLKIAGKEIYFYDAPYSYFTPSYAGCETAEEQYNARNEDNAKFIDLKCLDADKGLYTYYVTDDKFDSRDGYVDGAVTENNMNFAFKLSQVRTSGVYSFDIYDPDGDGRYEYVWYKPASFAQIDMNSRYDFVDDGYQVINVKSAIADNPKTKPVVYANGANLTGKAFNDEDFVIAYINSEANMIHIYDVVTAKKGTVVSTDPANAAFTFGNENFQTCYGYMIVDKYFSKADDNLDDTQAHKEANSYITWRYSADWGSNSVLHASGTEGTKAIVYYYNHGSVNNVMYYELLEGSSEYTADKKILIPLEAETKVLYDKTTFEPIQRLKVLIDGVEKYVVVNVDECYPAPTLTADDTYRFDITQTDENGKDYYVYLDKLCTYTVDKNGVYTITSMFHGKDEDGDFDHISLYHPDDFFDKEEVNQVGNDLGIKDKDTPVMIKKVTSTRYQLLDDADGTPEDNSWFGTYGDVASAGHWFDEMYITDNTTFIIRVRETDDDGVETSTLVTYKGKQFPGTTDSYFTNVQYIYNNYGKSETTAELVLFYGEVNEEIEFASTASKTGYRVIKTYSPKKVSEDEYRYSYTVFNTETGETETGILGTEAKKTAKSLADVTPLAPGAVIELTNDGKLDDEEPAKFTIDAALNMNFAFITDVYPEENGLEATPVRYVDNDYFTDDEGNLYSIYELDEEVNICLIKYTEKTNIKTAEFSKLTVEELAAKGEELLCYNSKYEDEEGEISTEYAKNIKAYMTFDKSSKDDFPVVDNIIVIVADGEPEEHLDLDE